MSTLFALAAIAAPALAGDLSSSLWHPGAEPMDSGYVGTIALASASSDHAGTWVGATGAVSPTPRLAASGTALVAFGSTLVSGGVRFNVVDTRWFRAAPVLFGAVYDHTEGETSHGIGAGLGVALEGGFTRVRFDTFVPIYVASAEEGPVLPGQRLPGFNSWDVGMTVRMGGAHRNRLRFGAGSDGGTLGYQHVGEHWFLESAMGAGPLHVSGWLRGGLVF